MEFLAALDATLAMIWMVMMGVWIHGVCRTFFLLAVSLK